MESSWFLLCAVAAAAAVLLPGPGSAEQDVHDEGQRDITFDLPLTFEKIAEEMQQADFDMLQKEADLSDIFGDGGTVEIQQRIVSRPKLFDTLSGTDGSRPGVLTPRGRRPYSGPRSIPPADKYPVAFPIGRPTTDNLQAVCLEGGHRPRYPDSYFPLSGYSQLKSMARAVNNAESWLSTCCRGNETWGSEVTLCCATQAWEQFVESFCEQDLSVKHSWYHCCLLTNSERPDCFQKSAPNPNYDPTEIVPVSPLSATVDFHFSPDTCQRTVMTQYSVRENRRKKEKKPFTSQKVDIHFPPGRPTEAAIDSLCAGQKLRPLYSVKCLPSVGYELLARQAKTINRIEKGFKHCCKKKQDTHICADKKWRDELDRFCSSKNGERVDYQCCSDSGASDRYDCFQNLSPDPHYNMTSAAEEEISINKVCDTHKMIKKMFPVGFPLKSLVSQCCPLSPQDQNSCFAQRLEEMSDSQCSSRKPSLPTVRRCCRMGPQKSPQCFSKIVVDAISKANTVLQRKKRKSCPIF